MDAQPLLPTREDFSGKETRPSAKHVIKIALRIKHLIDTIVPIQFEESVISRPDSPVITDKVVRLAREAAGGKGDGAPGTTSRKYRATLIFVLLIVKRWYRRSSNNELYDSELYDLRAVAAEYLAKKIIESETDEHYLFKDMLCQKYSITLNKVDSTPASALELAVDLHATVIIGSSGYQRCIKWLWRGWIVQSDADANEYEFYKGINNTSFWAHFTADRIKTPKYQNYIQLAFSFVYLLLYTLCVNTPTLRGGLDASEILFYLFTIGFVVDELIKLYHVGYAYLGFWNVFNDTLYVMISISFLFRALALSRAADSPLRTSYDVTSYNILACAAPMIWSRILLYLDSARFFGAMLVVLKELMKESLIFFVLLIIIAGGFLQAFIGLDSADGVRDAANLIVKIMTQTVLTSPEFEDFEKFAPPYGPILYYIFTFLITTILLNILIALFNSAYEKIYDNANDEYMALIAQKTLRFIRSPDENVYVAPLNLIELSLATLPFEWWMSNKRFQKWNDYILLVVYFPVLIFVAFDESRDAKRVEYNRLNGVGDDANENDEEWDLFDGYDDDSVHQASRGTSATYSAELEQINRIIQAGDPEFHIDETKWSSGVEDAAPKVELGDSSGVGWENYQLAKKIDSLEDQIKQLKGLLVNDDEGDDDKGDESSHELSSEPAGPSEISSTPALGDDSTSAPADPISPSSTGQSKNKKKNKKKKH